MPYFSVPSKFSPCFCADVLGWSWDELAEEIIAALDSSSAAGRHILLHIDEIGTVETARFDRLFPTSPAADTGFVAGFPKSTLRRYYEFWGAIVNLLPNNPATGRLHVIVSGKRTGMSAVGRGLCEPAESPCDGNHIFLSSLSLDDTIEILQTAIVDEGGTSLNQALGLEEGTENFAWFTQLLHELTAGVPRALEYVLKDAYQRAREGANFGTMPYDELKDYFRAGGVASALARGGCKFVPDQAGPLYAQLRCYSRFGQDLAVDDNLAPVSALPDLADPPPPISLLVALHTLPLFAVRGSQRGLVRLVEPGFARHVPFNIDDLLWLFRLRGVDASLLFEVVIGEKVVFAGRQPCTVREVWPTCFDDTPLRDLQVKTSFTLRRMGLKFAKKDENRLNRHQIICHLIRHPSASATKVVDPTQWATVLELIDPGVVLQFGDKSASCDVLWKLPMDETNTRFALVLFQAKFCQVDNGMDTMSLRKEVGKAVPPLVASLEKANIRDKYPEIWFVLVATNLGRLPVLQIDSTTAPQDNLHLEAVRQMAQQGRFGVSVWSDDQLGAFFGADCFDRLRHHAH